MGLSACQRGPITLIYSFLLFLSQVFSSFQFTDLHFGQSFGFSVFAVHSNPHLSHLHCATVILIDFFAILISLRHRILKLLLLSKLFIGGLP